MHLFSKLFFRLILPVVLALVLSVVWIFASVGRAHGSFVGWGWSFPGTDPRIFGIAAAAIFLMVFAVNLGMALKWGKEADEYAELLEEEKADELKRRSGRD